MLEKCIIKDYDELLLILKLYDFLNNNVTSKNDEYYTFCFIYICLTYTYIYGEYKCIKYN